MTSSFAAVTGNWVISNWGTETGFRPEKGTVPFSAPGLSWPDLNRWAGGKIVGREDLMTRGHRGPGRGFLMELLYWYGRMKQPDIGAMPGIDYSAVSIGRKRFLMMMEADQELKSLFEKVKSRISQG